MLRFDNETAESLRGVAWNAALEARAELEGLGFDHPISGTYRRSREVSAAVTSEMKSLHYLGGAVDWKKSGIGPDIQPVQVSVAPLSELLAPAVFYKHQLSVDSESLTDLNKRRALLAAAIRRNIGTYDEIERPCFVELELVKLTLPNEDKTEEIYGDVSLQLNLSDDFKESHPDTVLERTPFSRDMAPGHRVVIPAGGAMAFEAQNRMRLRFDDPQDKTLRSRKHGFMVYGRVFLYRGSVVVPLPHVELRGGFMVSFADIVKAYDPLGEAFLDGTWRARTDDAVEGVGWSTRARIHYRFRIVPLWLVAQQDWYPAQ
jgi:hypothetical protein